MRLEYIRSFIGVVNYKSFSLAAKYLFLSQPTISTHIKQLENELGVQLLVRSTKDVLLSEEGKIFYPYALKLIETENQALMHLNKSENEFGGTVSIVVSSVPGYYLFPSFLSRYREEDSDTRFQILEGDSGNVLQKILDFEADIGIGSLESGSDKIEMEVLFEDEIILITPNTARYRNMNGKFPEEQLRKEWFISRELGSGTKNAVEKLEQELKISIPYDRVAAQFESSEMVRRVVEEGVGIAFISKLAARESLEKQSVLEFDFPGMCTKRKFYLISHKERPKSAAVESLISGLRQYCAERY